MLIRTGYSGVFLVTSVMYLIIGTLVLVFFKSEPRKTKEERTGQLINRRNSSHSTRMPFLAFILLYIASGIYLLNTPLYIVHTLHAKPHFVGVVSSICAALEIPIMIFLGAVVKKISNHVLVTYGCLVASVYYAILGVSSHFWIIIVAQILQATFVAIVMGNGLSYYQDLLPDSPGVATTLYSNASSIGGLLGTLLGGVIAQIVGYRNVYWISLAVVALSFVILVTSKTHKSELVVDSSRHSM